VSDQEPHDESDRREGAEKKCDHEIGEKAVGREDQAVTLPAGADPTVIPRLQRGKNGANAPNEVEKIATIGQGVAATNCIETEFMPDRSPVGGGPSSRTWPR
jgi:hypothetical protein